MSRIGSTITASISAAFSVILVAITLHGAHANEPPNPVPGCGPAVPGPHGAYICSGECPEHDQPLVKAWRCPPGPVVVTNPDGSVDLSCPCYEVGVIPDLPPIDPY